MAKKKNMHSIQTTCLNSIHNRLGIKLETTQSGILSNRFLLEMYAYNPQNPHVKKEQTEFINIYIYAA